MKKSIRIHDITLYDESFAERQIKKLNEEDPMWKYIIKKHGNGLAEIQVFDEKDNFLGNL